MQLSNGDQEKQQSIQYAGYVSLWFGVSFSKLNVTK